MEQVLRMAVVAGALALALVAGCGGDDVTPADGSNMSACTDTQCQVEVRAGTALPVPESTMVGDLKVKDIADDRVRLTGRVIGNASAGGCYGPCSSNSSNGVLTVSLGEDGQVVENGLAVTVDQIDGDAAVLTIEPAG